MIKQPILFLLTICILSSCKEGTDSKANGVAEDTVAVIGAATELKHHPAEEKIAFYLSRIEKFRGANEYDSLEAANKSLMAFLKEACLDETLFQYPLKKLENTLMNVLTSADKKFRIYCWDTETGGTMHFYNAIAQYRTEGASAGFVLNDIASSDDEGDCGVWYDSLHTLNGTDRTYYLPVYYGRYSGNDNTNGISAYTIENGKLNDKPLIFKPKGKPLSGISYYYHNGMEDKESTENRITLSSNKEVLYIPITDDDDIVTDKYLVYKFDGNQFVFDKNAQ